MVKDTIAPEIETYEGFILLKREIDAHNESEAKSLILKRASDIKNDSILKDMEIERISVEEE